MPHFILSLYELDAFFYLSLRNVYIPIFISGETMLNGYRKRRVSEHLPQQLADPFFGAQMR